MLEGENMAKGFLDGVSRAAQEALKDRDLLVFMLWCGLVDGEQQTLQQIGNTFGVSRERSRQLLGRAVKRIRSSGLRQLRNEQFDADSAIVLAQLTLLLQPADERIAIRIIDFCETEMEHLCTSRVAIPLVARLVHGSRTEQDRLIELCRCALTSRNSLRYRELQTVLRDEAADTKVLSIADRADWPFDPEIAKVAYEWFSRAREVNKDRETCGEFRSAKLDRMVQYESSLEHNLLMLLERASKVKSYFEQPLAVPYEFPDGTRRTYYPDVLVELGDGRTLVVELKPWFGMLLGETRAKYDAAQKFCNARGWGYVMTDLRRTFGDIRNHEAPAAFQQEVLAALEKGPLHYFAYKPIADKYQASFFDMAAMTVREGLVWQIGPFRLWKP